ncbi:RNA 2'-phosphotransferase [Paraburkholderia sp. SIMBA_030]
MRAAQGHSVDVDLGYAQLEPPAVLYHGTTGRNWASVADEGLTPRTRHAVHLSTDVETATRVAPSGACTTDPVPHRGRKVAGNRKSDARDRL